jgi:hypothetical protein
LSNLRSFVRRDVYTGRERSARWQYSKAFEAVVRVEDAYGVDPMLSDRLLALRLEAQERHLLTPEEITDAEHDALARIEGPVSLDR